ncbi:fibronectin type III domain-containing protein [Ditylenchus destructor]|nr:fibronectin type III domain-containing protein [Ditylenchus destructor]
MEPLFPRSESLLSTPKRHGLEIEDQENVESHIHRDRGVDSHGVEISVSEKPSAPEGLLEVSDVYADHVTLDATQEGESDPLTTKDTTLAKNPFKVPDKVEKPKVLDWDKAHVEIEWKTPKDGGEAIKEYVIEKKDSRNHWVEAEHIPFGTNKASIDGLKQGEEYQFRVMAKNNAGLSEPSDPTDAVIAKPRHLAPHIHREDLEDTVVKVGGQVKFNVKIDGEPSPKVTWTFNGSEVLNGVDVHNVDYLSKFVVPKTTRKMIGSYTITATNDSETDSVTVKITVKSRPSAPKGPLEVSDFFEDHLTLDWNPSEDDGGDPITHYEVTMDEDCLEGIWVSIGMANDTHFVVEGLTKGSQYKFRVRAVNAEGKSDPLDTDQLVQAKNPFERPDKPGVPDLTDWDSDHVNLKWDPPASDGGVEITEYQIEKCTKYVPWETTVTVSGDTLQATVPNLINGEEYLFRVVAVNKGGPSDPSYPSKSVIAKRRHCKF